MPDQLQDPLAQPATYTRMTLLVDFNKDRQAHWNPFEVDCACAEVRALTALPPNWLMFRAGSFDLSQPDWKEELAADTTGCGKGITLCPECFPQA